MAVFGSLVFRPLLVAALFGALALGGPATGQPCTSPNGTTDDPIDPTVGFTPTFQSGDALPKEGVFHLALKPAADIIYLTKIAHAAEGGYGGIVTIERVSAGRYRIVFSQQARVEAVQGYELLPSQGKISDTRCSDGYRALEVAAEGGPLTLQVSGARKPLITIAVIRGRGGTIFGAALPSHRQ